jgi:hypothetical protein
VIFTKVLTLYHSWIHPFHHSPLSPLPHSSSSFNRSNFSIYIHVYIFLPYSLSYTLSLHGIHLKVVVCFYFQPTVVTGTSLCPYLNNTPSPKCKIKYMEKSGFDDTDHEAMKNHLWEIWNRVSTMIAWLTTMNFHTIAKEGELKCSLAGILIWGDGAQSLGGPRQENS